MYFNLISKMTTCFSTVRSFDSHLSLERNHDDIPYKQVFFVLFFLFVARILAMYFIPLNDSTEARYGEIARLMLEKNNWITLMHYDGVPFWAKPPLSTWLSAGSMKLLGVYALTARLPALLLSIFILALVWDIAKRRGNAMMGVVAILVLAGSLFFLLDAGTVMTDPTLLFCTTLSLIAFWYAVVDHRRLWGYVFFIGLGLGLLAKGPIAVVLCGMPIFFWVLWRKQWKALWRELPWVGGVLAMLAVALPWYWLAEMRTPGFIHYFIMGEHVSRFLQPGWTGDKYGFAHHAPLGMIWIYALLGIFPWTFVCLFWLIKHRKKLPQLCRDQDGWLSYLLLCTFVPLIFFTFARNIIYPYVFPSLPTFALLFAELTQRAQIKMNEQRWFIPSAAISGLIFLAVSVLFITRPEWIAKSQDRVVTACKKDHFLTQHGLIYWGSKTDYSALFYSSGQAISTTSQAQLCQILSSNQHNYVVIEAPDVNPFPADLLSQLKQIATIKVQKKQYTVFRAAGVHCKRTESLIRPA